MLTLFLWILGAYCLVQILYWLARHIQARRTGAGSRTKGNLVVLDEYRLRVERCFRAAKIMNQLTDERAKKACGDRAEAIVLHMLERAGKAAVYWNVGLNCFGMKTEFDVLVISPFGVLHLEVKGYTGTWRRTAGYPKKNPESWERVDNVRAAKVVKSPVSQALRARMALDKALNIAIRASIPIWSYLVFPDPSVKLRIDDDRLPFLNHATMGHAFQDFVDGRLVPAGKDCSEKMRPEVFGRLLTYLDEGGFMPVFFDRTLYEKHGGRP